MGLEGKSSQQRIHTNWKREIEMEGMDWFDVIMGTLTFGLLAYGVFVQRPKIDRLEQSLTRERERAKEESQKANEAIRLKENLERRYDFFLKEWRKDSSETLDRVKQQGKDRQEAKGGSLSTFVHSVKKQVESLEPNHE